MHIYAYRRGNYSQITNRSEKTIRFKKIVMLIPKTILKIEQDNRIKTSNSVKINFLLLLHESRSFSFNPLSGKAKTKMEGGRDT